MSKSREAPERSSAKCYVSAPKKAAVMDGYCPFTRDNNDLDNDEARVFALYYKGHAGGDGERGTPLYQVFLPLSPSSATFASGAGTPLLLEPPASKAPSPASSGCHSFIFSDDSLVLTRSFTSCIYLTKTYTNQPTQDDASSCL